jgi:hypothetical protein
MTQTHVMSDTSKWRKSETLHTFLVNSAHRAHHKNDIPKLMRLELLFSRIWRQNLPSPPECDCAYFACKRKRGDESDDEENDG